MYELLRFRHDWQLMRAYLENIMLEKSGRSERIDTLYCLPSAMNMVQIMDWIYFSSLQRYLCCPRGDCSYGTGGSK